MQDRSFMFESEFCKVESLEQYNAVFCQWKKACRAHDYRQVFEFGLDLINKKNARVWITDTTNGFENELEDTQWLLENFIPQTINSTYTSIVFIIKDDSPLKTEITEQEKVLSQYFDVIQIENIGLI